MGPIGGGVVSLVGKRAECGGQRKLGRQAVHRHRWILVVRYSHRRKVTARNRLMHVELSAGLWLLHEKDGQTLW